MTKHWSQLPEVRGFTRVPDEPGTGRRLLRCDDCGQIIPSLGVGYHKGGGQANARPCTERPPRKPATPVATPTVTPPEIRVVLPPAPAPPSDPYSSPAWARPTRFCTVSMLQGGHVVEAIERGDGNFVTPLGFPARLQAVRDNRDGTYTLMLVTDHWDKRRHVPGSWKVRLAG